MDIWILRTYKKPKCMKKTIAFFISMLWLTIIFSQVSQSYPFQERLFYKGQNFYEEGLYLQARETLNKYLLKRVGKTDASSIRIMLAELMLAKGAIMIDLDEGELLMENFHRKYAPEKISQEALFNMAEFYFDSKIYKESISYYDLVDTTHLSEEEKNSLFFKRGYAHYTRKDSGNANRDFSYLNDRENNYKENANYYLGIISFGKKDYESSLEYFEKAKGKKEYDPVIPYYQTQIHFALEDYDEVIEVGKEALSSKKKIEYPTEINQLVGKSYFEKEQYYEALPYLEKFESDAEELRAQDLYQVAYTRYKSGRYDKAIETFEELKNVKSELGQNSLFILANSYLKKGDKTSARNAFSGASKLPYDSEIQRESNFQYAKLSYDQGFDREAIDALRRVDLQDSNHTEAQRLLTNIFMSTKDYDRAINQMESMGNKSNELKNAYQKVTYYKGVELFNDNRFEASKNYLNKSIENSVSDQMKAAAVFRLGEIEYKLENHTESASHLLRFNEMAKGMDNLPEESSLYMSDYILGYNYMKLEKFDFAGIHFNNSINGMIDNWKKIESKEIKSIIFPDAILRGGDSHFNQNLYTEAIKLYQTSVQYKYPGYDYALFQKARILGVQGHKIDQVAALTTLTEELPDSPYRDDALFLLGKTYVSEGQFDKAEVAIYELVSEYSEKSNLINKGFLLLGLINYNQNEPENALKYYEATCVNNPTEGELNSALKSIQEIYVDLNNPEGFIDFKERVLGQTVSNDDKENLVYNSGEMQYESGNYPGAIESYTKYINSYPNGKYILQAYYNRAESHLANSRYAEALPDYDFVISKGNSGLYEKSLVKASKISYNSLEDFAKSYNYYSALTKVASNDDLKFEAQLGALRSAYRIGLTEGIYTSAGH